MFRDFARLQRWEREILKREDRSEGFIARGIRMIPWSGVTFFFFVMIFFGIDLGAGIKSTAAQIREKKDDAKVTAEMQKVQARQWSVEQVKSFRGGDLPAPSWGEGGPREEKNKHKSNI